MVAFAVEGEEDPPLLLAIADGRRPAVVRAPVGGVAATTVTVAEAELAGLLAGSPGVEFSLAGDPAGLERVRRWLFSAQSG